MSGSVIQAEARFAEARARAEAKLDTMMRLGIVPTERPAPITTLGDSIAECVQCQSQACDVELQRVDEGLRVTHHPRWPLDPEQD